MTEIREALAEALSAIPDYQVTAYMLADPTPPSLSLFPAELEYDMSFQGGGGTDDWTFTVQAAVGMASDIGAQQKLDELIAREGPSSVKGALEPPPGQPGLGGLVDDVRVESCTGYRIYGRPAGEPVLGAEWRVKVIE